MTCESLPLPSLPRLAASLGLGLLLAACGSPAPNDDDAADSSGSSPTGSTGGMDGPGASSSPSGCGTGGCLPPQTSGCGDGSAGCWPPDTDGCGDGTAGCWPPDTSGCGTSCLPPDTTTDDGGPGPLITTGNEDATEWDLTVRHTFTGMPPIDATYLATTVIYMDSEFDGVVAVPSMGGGTWYAHATGDHLDGVVTNLSGDIMGYVFDGTLQISDFSLDGSGTFSDQVTLDQQGTWEILEAVPHR